MKLISFQLTMPNKGSWNGKWSGENQKYYVVYNMSDKFFKSREYLKELLDKGHDNWYYSWGDGWGANVKAEIINSAEAKKRRKISKGFCGYNWMVDSIISHGAIYASHELPKKETEAKTNS